MGVPVSVFVLDFILLPPPGNVKLSSFQCIFGEFAGKAAGKGCGMESISGICFIRCHPENAFAGRARNRLAHIFFQCLWQGREIQVASPKTVIAAAPLSCLYLSGSRGSKGLPATKRGKRGNRGASCHFTPCPRAKFNAPKLHLDISLREEATGSQRLHFESIFHCPSKAIRIFQDIYETLCQK